VKAFVFSCHFWPTIPMVKVFVFSLSFLGKDNNGESFFFLGHFSPRITTVKVFDFLAFSAKDTNGESFCFFLVIFGQGYQR